MHSIFIVPLVLLVLSLCQSNFVLVSVGNQTYLFLNDTARLVPNSFTLTRLGLGDLGNVTSMTAEAFRTVKQGPPLPSLGPPRNVDEAMAAELTKIGIFQKNLIKSTIFFGKQIIYLSHEYYIF